MRVSAYVSESNLNSRAETWLSSIRDKVAPRTHLRPKAGRAALLVIDMLRYFVHPNGRCYLPAAKAIVKTVSSLSDGCRDLSVPVIYTSHCHTGKGDLGMLGKFFSDYIREGEEDASIIDELRPEANDTVFKKTTYDAFLGTELEPFLRARKINQLVITGVLTHMCCETTARSAFCRGFEVFVPVDGVASVDEERHLGSLLNMSDSVAVPTKADEVLLWLGMNRS